MTLGKLLDASVSPSLENGCNSNTYLSKVVVRIV